MLGVLLHSAQVYNPERTWVIYSSHSNTLLTYLVDIVHLFRMPAFFIVSGYFCLLTIKRYGPYKFINIRLTRIIIPLLVTAITLNSLQMLILTTTGWKQFDIYSYLLTGEWVSHLWFLINLIIYFLVMFIFSLFVNRIPSYTYTKANDILNKLPIFLILLILPLIWLTIKASNKIGAPIYLDILGIINIYELLFYFPFFLFGMWLRSNPDQLKKFSKINIFMSFFVICASLFAASKIDPQAGLLQTTTKEYLHTTSIWFSASICFYIFSNYANMESKLFMFLSDASYSVYLFHHIIVITIALILTKLSTDALTGFSILIILTTSLSIAIHKYIISRYKPLSFAFNGK